MKIIEQYKAAIAAVEMQRALFESIKMQMVYPKNDRCRIKWDGSIKVEMVNFCREEFMDFLKWAIKIMEIKRDELEF